MARYVDGRTDGRTCTRKREDDAARSLGRSHILLRSPSPFSVLAFDFPRALATALQ